MKVFILFLFFSCSISSYTQTKISVKLHLIHRDGSEQIHIKKNFEDFLEIFADVATTISVKEEDVLFFYINDELDVRRGRKLRHGDKIVVEGKEFIIENENQ